MIKSDRWIRRMAQEHDMINPYSEKQVSEGVISYGVSSYGYDLRVADEFKIFTNVNSTIVEFGLWMRGDRGSSGTRIREN
jgi:dCTP deaminase